MGESSESDLARKLAANWHLSVPERRALPPDGIAASKLLAAISDIINEASRYPVDWTADSYFDGIAIEPSDYGFTLRECRETGMGQFTHIGTTQVRSLEEAVQAFLRAVFAVDNVDGVPIDWNR